MRLLGALAGLVIVCVGGSLPAVADARAQAAPPTRVFGAVTLNGGTPPEGTPVEAFIDGKRCGSGTVRALGEPIGVGFVVDVDADSFNPGCGNDGEQVSFTVGGVPASERATFQTGAFLRLDLTASGQPSPTPTAQPGGPSTPAPTATPTPGGTPTPTATGTPAASPGGTPAATATGTATGTPATSPSPAGTATATAPATVVRPDAEEGDGDGVPPAVWVVLVLAVLAAGGVGAYLFQRRRAGPPA